MASAPLSAEGLTAHPYLPGTDLDRALMLARLGLTDAEDLFAALPAAYRDPAIDLPPALAEMELIHLMRQRAAKNRDDAMRPTFLGAGAYRRTVPSIVPYLVSRSEFMTAYTPYQPEISQGTLQTAFEYQSVVCELTGMDVSNTGLYDVASATAEACLLAARATGRTAVALLEPIHPGTVDVVRTYAFGASTSSPRPRRCTRSTPASSCSNRTSSAPSWTSKWLPRPRTRSAPSPSSRPIRSRSACCVLPATRAPMS